MSEIDFQVNEFRKYEAVVDGISFGFIDSGAGGYSPRKGEVVQYDGTTVVLKDGREFTDVPQLRTAIVEGWFVPIGKGTTGYRPKAAGVRVSATETRGQERPVKTTIETTDAEEREVGSVEERRESRERTNREATRRVPLESQAAKDAMARTPGWDSGDPDVNDFVETLEGAIEAELMLREMMAENEAQEEAQRDREEKERARDEADILAMLNSVEDSPSRSARSLPVERDDDRLEMPIVREDPSENAGDVVGSVSRRNELVVEREQEITLDVAPAAPERKAPSPRPRIGGAGAVVVDEQREVGQIALSGSAAPVRLDESAEVRPSGTDSIRMGEVEVGGRKKVATAESQDGVAVGRVLSPTQQSFTATDANTSSTAIQRTAEGRRVQVEKFAVDRDQEVAATSEKGGAVATGDVQEPRAGDDLTDLLPDAARGAEPEPRADAAYVAVKMMLPEFEWNRDRPLAQRVEDAMKHVKNPMYVKGILAVETEHGREAIKKALADELSGKKAKKAKKNVKGKEAAAKA